ncbi:(2Fe-2S)-binding protein [Romboutsia sp.]|uniref:(2Fe-2S)-binding protein n=1 Tax=Romboutsia sp. TaxID=1965302 RepID=UPI003F3CADCE
MDNRVCGCFNVTVEDLIKAKENGCKSVESIVKETKIGTSCGRCKEKSELTALKVLLNRLYIK